MFDSANWRALVALGSRSADRLHLESAHVDPRCQVAFVVESLWVSAERMELQAECDQVASHPSCLGATVLCLDRSISLQDYLELKLVPAPGFELGTYK